MFDQTVIAIEAPRASFIEVPDPDDDIGFCQKQYRLIVRSTTGPIGVYLLRTPRTRTIFEGRSRKPLTTNFKNFSKNVKKSKDISIKRTKLTDPPAWASGSTRVGDVDLSSSPSDTLSSSKTYGPQRIVPLDLGVDDDYWLRSDHVVSTSDLWS
ncbi:hypothetical protein OROGR_032800 [Orobanche gracilis]